MDVRERQLTLQAIDEKLERKPLEVREYLGISGLGDPCTRKTWLTFRWASKEKLEGRLRRLLDRGHREEAYVIRLLKSVGVKFRPGGQQQEVSLGPWVKGHTDGIIDSGLKESPNNPHVFECKTGNLKSFKDMTEKGVRAAQPKHFVQMQCYMLGLNMERSFYWMVCKDNDSVYTERNYLDREFAERYAALGNALAKSTTMPQANGNLFTQCKFCQHYSICIAHQAPQKNCRTCQHSRFCNDGIFRCAVNDKSKSKAQQLKGCENYQLLDAFRGNPWEKP